MDPSTHKPVAFFGRIAANMTHEVKNILAIIQESAGLMEDITAIAPLSEERFQGKFNNAMDSIKTQLQRGMDLTTRFNRFAHLPDYQQAQLDLAEVVPQLRILAERFARLKHIELAAADPSEKGLFVTTNPIRLYMVLFFSVESCLNVLPANSRITLTPLKQEAKPAVDIHCSGQDLPSPADFTRQLSQSPPWAELQFALEETGAAIAGNEQTPGFRVIFG
ncbi:MAG: hypothetical protein ACQERN_09285 [Thermodesulfobacteriota bacterium]